MFGNPKARPGLRWALGAVTSIAVVSSAIAVAQPGGVGAALRAPSSALGRLKAAIQQINLKACDPTVSEAASFLFGQGEVQFVVQPLGPDANRWPTVVTAEGTHGNDKQTRFTTLLVAPAGTCSGMYQQVIYWPDSCASVKQKVFGDFKNEKIFSREVRVSEANPGLQLYLMPAGAKGCVSIKKELIG